MVKLAKQRLMDARLERGLSQEQLAELAGVHQVTVSRWEKASEIGVLKLAGLARILEKPVGWFSGDDPTVRQITEPVAPYITDPGDGELGPVTQVHVELDVVGAISAGVLVEGWQEDLGQTSIPRYIIRAAPNVFALKVYGDSLVSEGILDGDIVVVDPDADFVDGRIYAVRSEEYNQTIAARRVYDMGRRYKLVSGDGSVVDVLKSKTTLLGRIRWSVPSIREH